jgi:ABC-type dipeptide/oligopeptide/nickel transport system permease component
MTGNLPEWVQRSPRFFYAAAVLMFFAYFALGVVEINGMNTIYADLSAIRLGMLRVLADALREAIYAVGTGVLVHVALAIWARMQPNTEAAE